MENHSEIAGHQCPIPVHIIIYDILSRLPVKSLLRFKCVSKSWRSLISSDKFIELHTKKADDDKEVFFSRRRVMFNQNCYSSEFHGPYSIDLDQFLHNHVDKPHEREITFTELEFIRDEVGSIYNSKPRNQYMRIRRIYFCNNLVLFNIGVDGNNGFYLANPATRQLKKLPDTPPSSPGIIGFGFDSVTNDYKVIDSRCYSDHNTIISVYSLKTDSWRQIECHSCYFLYPCWSSGVFFHGAIHCLATKADNSYVILGFDLAEERFYEIEPPIVIDPYTCWPNVGVFRDCLSITLASDDAYDTFSVMKEYGVSESWTTMTLVKPCTGTLSHIGFSTKSHDVMANNENNIKKLVMYQDGKELRIRGVPIIGTCVGVYVEGLFPLNQAQVRNMGK